MEKLDAVTGPNDEANGGLDVELDEFGVEQSQVDDRWSHLENSVYNSCSE